MSKVAVLKSERLLPDEEYLGPATVVGAVSKGSIPVELPSGARVHVTPAFVTPYHPAQDDVLLVIGRRGDHYALGVIHGTGRAELSFAGDVDLRAGGALRLSADGGVEIDAPRLEVRAGKIEMLAGAVVERFTSLYQRVSALFCLHAKDAHTVVEETSVTQAKSGVILTEETMSINGKQIHLG